MNEGVTYKKTTTALNLIIAMFALYLVEAVVNIISAGLSYSGMMSSSSIYGSAGEVNQGNLGTICLVGGMACLIILGLMVLIIMAGVYMILSKREVQELEGVAIPAGVLMIIGGALFIIPYLSVILFLIGLIIYLRKIVRPGNEMFLYIGAVGLGLALLISLAGVIMSFVLSNAMLSLLTSVVVSIIDMACYLLFLVAALNAKGNWTSWHKASLFGGQMPPMYYPQPGTMYAPGYGGYAGYPPPGVPPGPPGQGYPVQYPPQYRR